MGCKEAKNELCDRFIFSKDGKFMFKYVVFNEFSD